MFTRGLKPSMITEAIMTSKEPPTTTTHRNHKYQISIFLYYTHLELRTLKEHQTIFYIKKITNNGAAINTLMSHKLTKNTKLFPITNNWISQNKFIDQSTFDQFLKLVQFINVPRIILIILN